MCCLVFYHIHNAIISHVLALTGFIYTVASLKEGAGVNSNAMLCKGLCCIVLRCIAVKHCEHAAIDTKIESQYNVTQR